MTHGLRLFRHPNAVLSLISLTTLGLCLPAAGTAFATAQSVTSVAANPGATFTDGGAACAIEAGRAYCWGGQGYGEDGDGSLGDSNAPVAVDTTGVLAGKTLTQISAGGGTTCALDTSGAAYCWGGNDYGFNQRGGKLGFGPLEYSDVPVAVDTGGVLAGKKLVQISVGGAEVCALDSTGQAYCWGENKRGELGNGSTTFSDVPAAVDTSGVLAGKTLSQISAGGDYVCAVDTAGAAYCWGDGQQGVLGDNSTADSDVPVAVDTGVMGGRTFASIATGTELTTCGVADDGSGWCWGAGSSGQLGDNSNSNSLVPVAVDSSGVLAGKTLTQISVGSDSTCALDSSGAAYCWGDNGYGQLGDNSNSNSLVPVAVYNSGALAGQDLAQIALGGGSPCAMSASSGVYCWGYGFGKVPVEGPPSPPTAVTAAEGSRTARVSWTVPGIHTGVTGYTAIASPGDEICITSATHCTIGGLTNDTTYSVTVIARTATTNSARSPAVSVTPGSQVAFTSNPYATASFGKAFGYTVRATGGSPAPAITVGGTLPPGVTFTSHAGGTAVLAGTPDRGAVGLYKLTFTARSKAGVATQAFTLAVDRAPVFDNLAGTLTLTEREWVLLQVKTTGYPAAQLWQQGGTPPGTGFYENVGAGTGKLTGRIGTYTGVFVFHVVAASTSGEVTGTVRIVVDDPPFITSAASARVAMGFTLAFKVTATGVPAPAITESGKLPKGVAFHPSTATLSGTPLSGTGGTYRITFTAKNAVGTWTQHFTLTVT